MLSYYIGCRIHGSKEKRGDELSSDYELQRQIAICFNEIGAGTDTEISDLIHY